MTGFSPARIAKALAAAVGAAQIALGTAQAGGGGQAVLDWTSYQWVWFSVSVVAAFVGVYAIPNTKPGADPVVTPVAAPVVVPAPAPAPVVPAAAIVGPPVVAPVVPAV